MNQRVVRPPPKVIPKLAHDDSFSKPHAITPSFDFEAAVKEEMLRLQREMQQVANIQSIPSPHRDYQDDRIDQQSNYGNVDSISSINSKSPINVKNRVSSDGLSTMYGPSDDRKNMKAAKAAAYAMELEAQVTNTH